MLERMLTYKDDSTDTSVKTNHFEDGSESVKFDNQNFLTSIQMKFYGNQEDREKYDIWQEPYDLSNQLISYEKLSKYVKIVYNVEHKVEF